MIISFQNDRLYPEAPKFWVDSWIVCNAVIDAVLFFDIIACDRWIPFINGGEIVTEESDIRRIYRAGRLKLDVFTLFPLDWIMMAITGYSIPLYFYAMLRLNKLFRLIRFPDALRDLETYLVQIRNYHFKASSVRFAKSLVSFMLLHHTMACAWFFVSVLSGIKFKQEGIDGTTWTEQNESLEFVIIDGTARALKLRSLPALYLRALYFAAASMTTVVRLAFIFKFSFF